MIRSFTSNIINFAAAAAAKKRSLYPIGSELEFGRAPAHPVNVSYKSSQRLEGNVLVCTLIDMH